MIDWLAVLKVIAGVLLACTVFGLGFGAFAIFQDREEIAQIIDDIKTGREARDE